MKFTVEREFLSKKARELFGIDTRTLALFRILLGVVLLLDLWNRLPWLSAFHTDLGVLPRDALLREAPNIWIFSLHLANGTTLFQALLFLIAAVFAVMLLVGYRTRLATIVSWVMLISLQGVNFMVLQGGDVELRVLLFWAMFLPLGRAFSVDAALSFREPKKEVVVSMASAAILLQVSFVYLFAIFHKTGVEWTHEFSAVWYALSLDQFSTPIGEFILQFPLLLTLLTIFVLYLQKTSFFLLFFPLGTAVVRTIGMSLLILMHTGFFLNMHIGLFPIISITGLLLFLQPQIWDFFLNRLKTPERRALTLYFDGDCGFCKKSVHLIRTFLLIPETTIAQGQTNENVWRTMQEKDTWVIVDSENTQHLGFQGGVSIAKHSPLLWWLAPLGKLSFFQFIGHKVYRFVATHRKRVCLPGETRPDIPLRGWKQVVFNGVVFMFFAYVVAWNLQTINALPVYVKNEWWAPLFIPRLDQHWNMFAPFPSKDDGWYVVHGKLRNGDEVDLLTGEIPTYERPENMSATYVSDRWRKYLTNLWASSFSQYRLYYARYLCREWNNEHAWDYQVLTFDITYMLEKSGPAGPFPIEKHVTWSHSCF